MNDAKLVQFYMPAELAEKIKRIAEQEERTFSAQMRIFLKNALREYEKSMR